MPPSPCRSSTPASPRPGRSCGDIGRTRWRGHPVLRMRSRPRTRSRLPSIHSCRASWPRSPPTGMHSICLDSICFSRCIQTDAATVRQRWRASGLPPAGYPRLAAALRHRKWAAYECGKAAALAELRRSSTRCSMPEVIRYICGIIHRLWKLAARLSWRLCVGCLQRCNARANHDGSASTAPSRRNLTEPSSGALGQRLQNQLREAQLHARIRYPSSNFPVCQTRES